LAMSEVPGQQLDEVLNTRRGGQRSLTPQERRASFTEACAYAGELVAQLGPIVDACSAKVYHRDITPRNIQVAGLHTGKPRFGLVDFGLAITTGEWHSAEDSCGDLGGDGCFWPTSAWFVFGHGSSELKWHPALYQEYVRCWDVHSLGLSGVRCFADMLPDLTIGEHELESAPWMREVVDCLGGIQAAWRQYWKVVCQLWEPILETVRLGGDLEALRSRFAAVGAHEMVAKALLDLQRALLRGESSLAEVPEAAGLTAAAPLFRTLLAMLRCPSEEDKDKEDDMCAMASKSTCADGSSPSSASSAWTSQCDDYEDFEVGVQERGSPRA